MRNLDRNGRIDSGTELFGNHTALADGYATLVQYDDNGDGIIDAKDPIW